jgi:hypothetical protein
MNETKLRDSYRRPLAILDLGRRVIVALVHADPTKAWWGGAELETLIEQCLGRVTVTGH